MHFDLVMERARQWDQLPESVRRLACHLHKAGVGQLPAPGGLPAPLYVAMAADIATAPGDFLVELATLVREARGA